jgi:hypothetical protein
VADLEAMAESPNYMLPWSGDAVAFANSLIAEGRSSFDPDLELLQVYRPVSVATLKGLLDTVQTRILDLALSLEHLAPEAGELGSKSVSSEQMSQQFHTHVYGGATNIAQGSSNFTQHAGAPAKGDEAALLAAMGQAGVPAEEIDELQKALAADREEEPDTERTEPGPNVQRWWSRVSLGKTAGKLAIGAGGGLAAKALGAFFGLG